MVRVEDLRACTDCGSIYYEMANTMSCPKCDSFHWEEVTK